MLIFRDNIWGADLADMQLISNYSKGFWLLLCVINISGKCAWVVPWKTKKVLQLPMLFKKFQMSLGTKQTKYGLTKAIYWKINEIMVTR